MRLHHVGGYTDEERDGYREIVYANLVRFVSFRKALSSEAVQLELTPYNRDRSNLCK